VRGRVCGHCRLDEGFFAWELRLFALHTRALTAGTKARGAPASPPTAAPLPPLPPHVARRAPLGVLF